MGNNTYMHYILLSRFFKLHVGAWYATGFDQIEFKHIAVNVCHVCDVGNMS